MLNKIYPYKEDNMEEFTDGMGYAPETDEELEEGLEEDQVFAEIYDSEDPEYEDEDGEEIFVEAEEDDNELPVVMITVEEEESEGDEDYDPRDDPDFYEDKDEEGDSKEKEDPDLENIIEVQDDSNN